MNSDWKMDPTTRDLVSPPLARSFRVIPLGEEGDRLKLLIGQELTDTERQKKEAALQFYFNRSVTLWTLREVPELASGFDEVLDYYYPTAFPDMMSKPVGRQTATVLLLDPDTARRDKNKQKLVEHGFIVVEVATVEQALVQFQSPCCEITEVLIPSGKWADKRSAIRRLRAVTTIKVGRVDTILEQCNCGVEQS